MLGYLQAVCHPDKQLALFNDSAMNMTPTPDQLFLYGQSLGIDAKEIATGPRGCRYFSSSGLVRIDRSVWALLFDTGAIGPDYIPGHAHADNLTFELSLQGKRLVVDTGTGLYASSDKRQYQRSTAAHNTIRIDGIDSSEVWSSFRVARRARPSGPAYINSSNGEIVCRAAHNGFSRLAGKVMHLRWMRVNDRAVVIQDDLFGDRAHQVELFLHFHPDFYLQKDGTGWMVIDGKSSVIRARIIFQGIDCCGKEKYEYSPEFGVFLEGERLTARKSARLPCTLQTIILYQSSEPGPDIQI
jgi:uncharacterized heparinase superfamily protein